MRAFGVVVGGPGGDVDPRVCLVEKHGLVEQFVAHPTFKTLHEAVLHGWSRRDVVPFDLLLGTRLQDRITGQLGPVVADNHSGFSAPLDQGRQIPCHTSPWDRGIRGRGQAFTGDVVYNV